MLGKLSLDQIEQVLHSQVLGRIGCHSGNRTYIVPITYAYDGERIICHSANGLKIQMMRENPEVCFEVEQVENLANWQSVIAWGRYEELQEEQANQAIKQLVDRILPLIVSTTINLSHTEEQILQGKPYEPLPQTVIFCIHLLEKSGRFEKR
ncbi:pyridoxamine 5'-phosphate oxidase family protein [Nostoc sp. UIC 10607]|uniref:pyridoxamine 5'-phosphate oxidase family protein n=1 Tax=Nostoc sp. UIC 10607 TaxID=3045935 RepID=UPI0039A16395